MKLTDNRRRRWRRSDLGKGAQGIPWCEIEGSFRTKRWPQTGDLTESSASSR